MLPFFLFLLSLLESFRSLAVEAWFPVRFKHTSLLLLYSLPGRPQFSRVVCSKRSCFQSLRVLRCYVSTLANQNAIFFVLGEPGHHVPTTACLGCLISSTSSVCVGAGVGLGGYHDDGVGLVPSMLLLLSLPLPLPSTYSKDNSPCAPLA